MTYTPVRVRPARTCDVCGESFIPKGINHIRCSTKCRKAHNTANYSVVVKPSGLTPGTAGAIGELRVSIELMARGYQIFRALSPSCPCDLIALRDNETVRIEVRTTYFGRTGNLIIPHNDPSKFDVLAMVTSAGIFYEPSLP